MVEKVSRLNEQGATTSRIDRYLHPWRRWVTAGLGQRLLTDPLEVGLTTRRQPMTHDLQTTLNAEVSSSPGFKKMWTTPYVLDLGCARLTHGKLNPLPEEDLTRSFSGLS